MTKRTARFEKWNKEKQEIHNAEKRNFFVNTREIWFTKMGQNIGYEENGKDEFLRPVLVLKKVGNLFFVVALTTKGKIKNRFYHKINQLELHNPKYQDSSYVILSQAKVMDKKRFFENAGNVSISEFEIIKEKLRTILF